MNYLELLKLHNTRKCPYAGKCKARFEDGVVRVNREGGKITGWYPDGGFLFHYQDTHGFPHEMMIEEFQRLIDSEMTKDEVTLYNNMMKNHTIAKDKELSAFDMRVSNG